MQDDGKNRERRAAVGEILEVGGEGREGCVEVEAVLAAGVDLIGLLSN